MKVKSVKKVRFGEDIAFEIVSIEKHANFNFQQVAMEINLPFSFFSIFIDTDHLTIALEQKLGRSGGANQTYL